MNEINIVEVLLGLVIMLMGGWLLRLESKGNENATESDSIRDRVIELEKDLARNYHSKSELRDVVQDAMKPVHDELGRLSRAVERLSNRDSREDI